MGSASWRDRRHLGLVTLEWAAQEGRVLLAHDISTMTVHAYARVSSDLLMPGFFAVIQLAPINQVIEDLLLLAECGYSPIPV